jgi:hypothetical protein
MAKKSVIQNVCERAIEMVEFLDWVGCRYYRVSGWKWRQIRDENDKTEYPSVVLWAKFMDSKREGVVLEKNKN